MSAWTAIIIPAFIAAKCALDIVGMEYGSKYQLLTDNQFFFIAIVFTSFGFIVDMINFWNKILRQF